MTEYVHIDQPTLPAPAWLHLARAWECLSDAKTEEDVAEAIKATGRAITGADGITFIRREGEFCHYVLEDAVAPLWAGSRFPLTACISGWCMLHKRTAAIADIYKDERIPAEAYKGTFVSSLAMVPVGNDVPVAAIGAYWAKRHIPSDDVVTLLQQLAHAASYTLDRIARSVPRQWDNDVLRDVADVQRIPAVELILNVVCEITKMGFAAVARVTDDRWIACAVRDEIAFGLKPGEELDVKTTLCDEVRHARQVVVIDDVRLDKRYCSHHTPKAYGFRSYISVPIVRRNGDVFGTLCAIDPSPAEPSRSENVAMFKLFAELIAGQLDAAMLIAGGRQEIEQQKLQERLREEFIGVLGHDLRNPLAAMHAGLALLSRKARDDQLETVGHMQKAVRRMSGLVNDMLDYTRGRLAGGMQLAQGDGQLLQTALQDVVSESILASGRADILSNIAITRPVYCDVPRMSQLLSNLLSNAVSHGSADNAIRVAATTDAEKFVLTVSNAGAVIPSELRAKLFEPYTKRHSSGLGLGLYICSEIARAHGGRIGVVSDDKATTFRFEMPLTARG